ncbi:polyprenol monophosphomannose synthase [Komagataeibacter xylinus]|uniref:Polyprenol monophosphomannose synthase n=2 Tax=Komagataeibacter rhaeticus TaxID=215221 RepID=A0A181C6H6_9PROT|nr:polyprenol monophosphomannose synthase [Komagataeibacter xylinus]QIP34167.1 polyprenol monophosphomannose synthase [Komagataeibacter rhaeticus]QOC46676.1 polyprenol monophosphomannose synthase [Komagataeibacter rhaeticus]SAY47162.1 Undecaprenyl-phosphate mannosyltransferase [Komagataeibacter rhaeticus]
MPVSSALAHPDMYDGGTVRSGPALSIIIPCYNECGNVEPLFRAVERALPHLHWELIFVDDSSPDGTIGEVWRLAQADSRVRGILRVGRRGLSSAVIEGVLSSSAPVVAVMDGDMQHDERLLARMFDAIQKQGYEVAIGSRHVEGGDNSGLANAWRLFLSDAGIRIAQHFLSVRISDPMSGFFAVRRDLFVSCVARLSGTGFKILLDMLMAQKTAPRVVELPFVFRSRHEGESKMDRKVLLQFGQMIAHHVFARKK